jgi:parallel beta-helix repeat protein
MRTRSKVLATVAALGVAGALAASAFALDAPAGEPDTSSAAAPSGTTAGMPYPGDAAAETQLADQEAARLVAVKTAASAGASSALDTTRPFRAATSGRATLILPARAAGYTLAELAQLAPQTLGADGPEGAYVLREHLAVMTGASLAIGAGERLLLAGDGTGFSSIVALGGSIGIEGSAEQAASLASWDPNTGGHDEATADGRPYLRVVGGGLRIVHARIEALGFWSGATSGVSFEGQRSADLVPTPAGAGADGVPTMQLTEAPAPGSRLAVSGVEVDGNAVGMTIAEADAPSLTNLAVSGSLVDGVVLDRDVSGATLTRVTASENARDGVVVGRGSQAATLNRVTADSNGRNGVLLDGRARADGPSTEGTTGASAGSSVVGGVFSDNARSGIDVVGGSDIRLRNNTVSGGGMGIVLDEGPRDVEIRDSEISDAGRHGISIRDGAENVTVAGNDVARTEIGVYVRNAEAVVRDNTVAEATIHGITLTGDLAGTQATGNELSGTGPTAIDSDRAIDAHVEGNVVDGWAASRSLAQIAATVMQPLTIVWLIVTLLIGVALITRLGAGRKHDDPLAERRPLQSMSRGIVRRADAGRNAK